ncbi:MAG: pyridoxamine 5-phosphate oxidase, partial [Pseudomonadota bacterium]
MPTAADGFRLADDDARAQARAVLASARHAAIGVIDPMSGGPSVTRIAIAILKGAPHTLISTLSSHTAALKVDPRASLLLGEPGAKGDPLTHPRLSLRVTARPAEKATLRHAWLAARPKSGLYYDFTDFELIRFEIEAA